MVQFTKELAHRFNPTVLDALKSIEVGNDGVLFFVVENIRYEITQILSTGCLSYRVDARRGKDIIGNADFGINGGHITLWVNPQERGGSVGSMLFWTKVALDGIIPDEEWSAKYSRIYFLIKQGYMPVSYAGSPYSPRTTLNERSLDALARQVASQRNKKFPTENEGDIIVGAIYFKFNPEKALEFLEKMRMQAKIISM